MNFCLCRWRHCREDLLLVCGLAALRIMPAFFGGVAVMVFAIVAGGAAPRVLAAVVGGISGHCLGSGWSAYGGDVGEHGGACHWADLGRGGHDATGRRRRLVGDISHDWTSLRWWKRHDDVGGHWR